MERLGSIILSKNINNLNAVRLILALAVIISHSFPICYGSGGEAKGEPLVLLTNNQMALGNAAVNLFFVISGMLITASWLRSGSMQEFLWKRILRIYPAFIVALAFSGLVIWTLCPEFRASVGRGISWSFLFLNDCIFLGDKSLGAEGVFAHNPWNYNANGSLWTISIEFQYYLLVVVLGLFCLFKRRWLLLVLAVGSLVFYGTRIVLDFPVYNHWSRFATCFLFGVCLWLWRDKIPISKRIAQFCFLGLILASQFTPWFSILMPVLAGYLTIWVGYGMKTDMCLSWTRKTDLSYGTYLFAFPIQQIFAMYEPLRIPYVNSILSIPVVLILAWISWNYIESRFLLLKNVPLQDFDPGAPEK